jgi:hypothetical protein
MRKQLAFVVVIISANWVCAAHADSEPDVTTVHGLYQACTDPKLMFLRGYCFGFIDGVGMMMHASSGMLEKQGIHLNTDWCEPGGTTREQAVQAFKSWHDAHPQHWQLTSVAAVITALQASWPCPGSQPSPQSH